ncbi:hypothetical protein [Nitratireductor indicus]|uniref:hypothetical protein n=1 Tax=Nitratireductor indicus TaxID=721133 RepID=UPI0011608554|nr:hypothetical protein [Nitratireductor indicus]
MIPEYRLFHGAAICALIDQSPFGLTIGHLGADGRSGFYIINQIVGLYIKHSTARLTPWQFSFTGQNIEQFLELRSCCREVFVALVCGWNGIVCLDLSELKAVAAVDGTELPWVRVTRRPKSMFTVSGDFGVLKTKKRDGFIDLFRHPVWGGI